jgi:NodT family efflux transporter outer membrane factor (OMF) lipoprotein
MRIRKLIGTAILFLIPGCALVGPCYKPPCIKIPCTYEQSPEEKTVGALNCWWHQFDDHQLNHLIDVAVENNYTLRAAVEKIQEMRWNYNIKTAELLPQIDGFGFILRNRYSKDIPLFNTSAQNPTNLLGLGVATLWELDLWGRLRRAQSAALAEYRAQIETARDVYIILLADVAELYIAARSLEIQIGIRQQQYELDQEIMTLTRDLSCSGLSNDIPPEIQTQNLLQTQEYICVLEKMLAQTCYSLAVLLGKNPESFCLEAGSGKVPLSNGCLKTGIPSELLRRRPDIRAAEEKLIAANERIGESIGEFFPKFSLLGAISSLSSTFSGWFSGSSLSWTIGPAFSWPIITFGRISYDVKAKKSAHWQALYVYCQAVIEALADVEKSLVGYFTAQQTLELSTKRLQSIKTQANLVATQFNAGLVDRLHYAYIQKQQLEVLIETIDHQKEVSSALVRVYRSLGGGWDCD